VVSTKCLTCCTEAELSAGLHRQADVAAAAGAQSKDGGAKPTSMMRAFAVAKSSFSMAEVRVGYRRYSSHPAFNEMAVGLHL